MRADQFHAAGVDQFHAAGIILGTEALLLSTPGSPVLPEVNVSALDSALLPRCEQNAIIIGDY